MRTEHAEILEIGSASLLKVRLLKTNTDERVTASLTQKAKDEGLLLSNIYYIISLNIVIIYT